MRCRMITGLAASVLAVVIPLLMGMGAKLSQPEPAKSADTVQVETVSLRETDAADEERTVQAIVVHESEAASVDSAMTVSVEVDGEMQDMTLQEYLVGVLMGEMPASFEPEALKAQAVAARTYALKQLENGGTLSDDPAVCQAFADVGGAQEKWGESWETYLAKINQAVEETDGQVLTYDGVLILATYFSCSGGKTESAQAVWGSQVPYLISVDSPGEETASAYESEHTVEMSEFLSALGISEPAVSAVTYTEGGGVETITIGGETFSGTQMRSLFGLRSTRFFMAVSQDSVTFSVQGFGHRVGLSQYGAQAMAESGSSYEEILKWYYTGVEIETYAAL